MGLILAAATWEMVRDPNPLHAEAQALYNTTRLEAECCFTSVIFESDYCLLVQAMKTEESHFRSYLRNYFCGIHCN
ncbi:hypothetical protein L195_g036165 [Trifolium pratense]|uniref:Uncharacterized protein n=1 Tax=Trifolium pratense TaxID=57577 RepID=A0A2K3LNQ1_TRIPR|nr:hypothetical protein L195_g036165 [Trifolium pratense]